MISLETARKWYPPGDPVHDFFHIERVYRLAESIATAEGADLEIVRAAALLHDAQGSAPGAGGEGAGDSRGAHHLASAEFAAETLAGAGWPADRIEAVAHCIRAHRFRSTEAPQTLEARVLFDADKLDVLGAVGAARTVAYAALAGQPIYAKPSPRFQETGEREPGEPHSSFHEYLFKLKNVAGRMYTRTGRALARGRHEFLKAFYEQLAAEVSGDR